MPTFGVPFRRVSSLASSAFGVSLTCARASAVAEYDAAVDAYAGSRLSAFPLAQRASESDSTCVAAHALAGSLAVWSGGGGRGAYAGAIAREKGAACVRAGRATAREATLVLSAEALAAGRLRVAARVLDDHLERVPTDLLAIRLAVDAWRSAGDAASAFRTLACVFQSWDPRHRGAAHVAALLAGALVDTGNVSRAEGMAASVLSADPGDTVAVMAAARSFLSRGGMDEAARFLRETEDSWGGVGESEVESVNVTSLHALAAGLAAETGGAGFRGALARYDAHLAAACGGGVASVGDAARTLWLLDLLESPVDSGVIAGGAAVKGLFGLASGGGGAAQAQLHYFSTPRRSRWSVLADFFDNSDTTHAAPPPLRNPSADVIGALVLAKADFDGGVGERPRGEALAAHLKAVDEAAEDAKSTVTDAEWLHAATASLGLPPPASSLLGMTDTPRAATALVASVAARGLVAYAQRDFARASTLLSDARGGWGLLPPLGVAGGDVPCPPNSIAGLLELTLISTAAGSPTPQLLPRARALAGARTTLAPQSPLAWAVLGGVLEKCAIVAKGERGAGAADHHWDAQVRAAKERAHALGWNQGATY